MTWFENIYDLQYYNQPKGVPCYCEAVANPADLYLQGQLPTGNANYTLALYVYSADGLTQYEDATTYFDYYFGKKPGGEHFFNARLKSFSPSMCAHECYIIRAIVTQHTTDFSQVIFDKYTERYCQNNCCDVARGIKFDQDGFVTSGGDIDLGDPTGDATNPGGPGNVGVPVEPAPYQPTSNCGEPLIRIISKFDCIDKFTGDFFEKPDVTLAGTTATFTYRHVTTIKGRIVRRPRNIKREISYNCRLQRVESKAEYLLEGFEYLPPWKMYEIEAQLHANHIYIDDYKGIRKFQYAGGTPVKQINKCFELFKLEATLEECTQRQVFGCADGCEEELNYDGSMLMFAIPGTYNNGGFYSEQGVKVANEYDELIDYLRTRDGITDVQDVDVSSLTCEVYKVLSISGTGYLPAMLYYDEKNAAHRVYGRKIGDVSELCNYLPPVCKQPESGAFTIEEYICATPVAGTFTVETDIVNTLTINGYGSWETDDTETYGTISNNEVRFSIDVTNTQIVADSGEDEVGLIDIIIGSISSAGRPSGSVVLNETNNATMPTDVSIIIDSYGLIHYNGPASATLNETTINIDNLVYNM